MRALMVGGGCRGLRLARDLVAEGHAVRAVTRTESRRAEIEAAGCEC
jgi:Trk K+ transport system NAD-binding subunit